MFPDATNSCGSILIVDDIASNIHLLRGVVQDMADLQMADTMVIFVAPSESASHALQALRDDGVDFLQKPLPIPVAHARILAHLQLCRLIDDAKYQHGPVRYAQVELPARHGEEGNLNYRPHNPIRLALKEQRLT
ncbi:hypothetical protein [Undibacterium sp. TS12]|uniref:hypothetical protein n=1 Tax=Undibacterium sp. TS12 TaxID=2908202 RepID=UPI001F4C5951|nr:hypothetical protein [Undibacterium sp. TS12]MCH8620489.1 hypothetical protein [Undibacterium sp. TS12]